jgi:hypothetical protein
LEDAHLNITSCELVVDVRERNLNTRAAELTDREKRLVERQMQELTIAQKMLEELLASRAGEARRVWDFVGQIEATPVPLGFSPLHSGLPTQEIGTVLPLLDSAGAKMSQLEEVIGGRLEEEGFALAEAVTEHVLLCFRNQDPRWRRALMQRPRR